MVHAGHAAGGATGQATRTRAILYPLQPKHSSSTLVCVSLKSCYRSVALMEGKMPGMVREALAPARTEQYLRQILSKIHEVRQGLSARRAAEFVQRPEEPLDFGDWCQKSHDEWLFVNQNRL